MSPSNMSSDAIDIYLNHTVDQPILCVGDAMIDQYIYGQVARISPEAPIPVLQAVEQKTMLGGAGNVVRNLEALTCPVHFLTVIGDDEPGQKIAALISSLDGVKNSIFVSNQRKSPLKIRYIADNQQLLRVDHEQVLPIGDELMEQLCSTIDQLIQDCSLVILSDYGKGLLIPALCQAIIASAKIHHKKVIVDPKGKDYQRYCGAFLITPNKHELSQAVDGATEATPDIVGAALKLAKSHHFDHVLVTRGKEGMTLVQQADSQLHEVLNVPAKAKEIYDVSGAGDTVVAAIARGLALRLSLDQVIPISNVAAGIVVGKLGTATVCLNEIREHIFNMDRPHMISKLANLIELLEECNRWRSKGLKIGFTNGCFDLLHPGHVGLLNFVRANCDRVIVGLNSDQSIKKLKGPMRPIQSEMARATVLSSLEPVHRIVLFDDLTPIKLIEAIAPDLLVKGGDYQISQIVGADFVTAHGGEVKTFPLVEGFSTSQSVEKIKQIS